MSTRNEYIASIMLEAADLLQESYGANGAARRFYDERIKRDQDFINKNQRKAEQYERAGYGDRGPSKDVAKARERIEYNKREKRGIDTRDRRNTNIFDTDNGITNRVRAEMSRDGYHYNGYNGDYSKAYRDGTNNKRLSDKQKRLHDRINKRAALKEAIDLLYDKAANADTLDEATMYIDKAEQLESMIEE